MLRAKTIVDYLDAFGRFIYECEMVLCILNGLGPMYLTFVTTFNMVQVRPLVSLLPLST